MGKQIGPFDWVMKSDQFNVSTKMKPVEWVNKKGPGDWVMKRDQLNRSTEKGPGEWVKKVIS